LRPLRLKINAFGPFPDEETIDFEELGNSTFFLIHGPTGAGKTAILDAICFALYGESSGHERDPRGMRSDNAHENTLTEVMLDFSVGNAHYRINRQPGRRVQKKSGEGYRLENPKTTLWQRTGILNPSENGHVITSKTSEVNKKINSILGFKSDQFRQVVVLPQGQYRQLLVSGSKEKEGILEVLFQTEKYRRIEEALKTEEKEIKDELVLLEKEKEILLNQSSVLSKDELQIELNKIKKTIKDNKEELKGLEKKEQESLKKLQKANEDQKKLTEFKVSEEEFKKLNLDETKFKKKELKLDQAEKAQSLQNVERNKIGREEELKQASEKMDLARNELEGAKIRAKKAQEDVNKEKEKESERTDADENLLRLKEMVPRVQDLATIQKELKALTEENSECQKIFDGTKVLINKNQVLINDTRELFEKHRKTAEQLGIFKIRKQEAEKNHKNRNQLIKLENMLITAKNKYQAEKGPLETINGEIGKFKKDLDEKEKQWLEGQSAILAKQLLSGKPCPVCGSTEHPSPSGHDEHIPDQNILKELKGKINVLDLDRQKNENALSHCDHEISRLEIQTGIKEGELEHLKDAEIEVLEELVEKTDQDVINAQKSEIEKNKLEDAIKDLEGENKKLQIKWEKDGFSLQNLNRKKENQEGIVSEKLISVPAEFHDIEALEKKIKKTEIKKKILTEQYEEASREQNLADQKLTEKKTVLTASTATKDESQRQSNQALQEFKTQILHSGFSDESEYRGMKLEIDEISKLKNEIQSFRANLQSAQDRFGRAKIEADGVSPLPTGNLEKENQEIKACREKVNTEIGSLSERSGQMAKSLDALVKNLEKIKDYEKTYGIISKISQTANGKIPGKINFQRYILASLLDEVLISASERLKVMSKGRFRLQRSLESEDMRAAGGLDLEVYDLHTGTNRNAKTLSGGESFLASLSLALGLSDVVQAYAGGIKLETMFIDEGFGSLDPEVLELAIQTLIGLNQDGRLVGIVSHVPELKELIDKRLEVVPGKNGSTVNFC
jgi:DNA repair protein SbcC/Rad50